MFKIIELKLQRALTQDVDFQPRSFLSSSTGGEEILGFFLLIVSLLSLNFELWLLGVELHELSEIELGFLEKLNLSHEDVLEGEDLTTFLLNCLTEIL